MSLIRYFNKSCIVFCAKPKEAGPIKLNFYITNKRFGNDLQQSIKILWVTAWVIGIPFFLSKISIPAIEFYWRNYTHNICHRPCSSLNLFVPELVRLLACSSYNYYLFIYFTLFIPYIDSLDKCHSSAFNSLILSIGM